MAASVGLVNFSMITNKFYVNFSVYLINKYYENTCKVNPSSSEQKDIFISRNNFETTPWPNILEILPVDPSYTKDVFNFRTESNNVTLDLLLGTAADPMTPLFAPYNDLICKQNIREIPNVTIFILE